MSSHAVHPQGRDGPAASARPPVAERASSRPRARLVAASGLAERHARLAGVDTAILEGGDGPPILLLHGQGEFWAVWMPVIRELVTTNRVVAVDLPGHGASGWDEDLDHRDVMTWLEEVLTATCPEPPIVAGHLLGGAMAARHAIDNGDDLAHLVLVDSMGLGWFRPSLRFMLPMARFMVAPTAQTRDRLFAECFVDFDRVGRNFGDHWDDVRDCALESSLEPIQQAALRRMLPRLGMPPIAASDLAHITTPTSLIHGRHDLQVDLALAQRASRMFGWPLHVVDDARDDPAAECPAQFVAALRAAVANGTTSATAATDGSLA